jgi:hypothetical protein
MSAWTAFWLMVLVWVLCEAWHFHHGADTALWQYRTPPELELQRHLIERRIKQ